MSHGLPHTFDMLKLLVTLACSQWKAQINDCKGGGSRIGKQEIGNDAATAMVTWKVAVAFDRSSIHGKAV